MRKIYLPLLSIFSAIGVMAQTYGPGFNAPMKNRVANISLFNHGGTLQKAGPSGPAETAIGDTIKYFDFSNSSEWTINGASPNGWEFSSTNVGWADFNISPINSSSGGQYLILEDGDPTMGTNQGGPYFVSTNTPIDFSNNTTVIMSFELHGAKFFDDLTIEYSLNNSTWSEIMNITDLFDNLTASGGSPTANPEYIQTNISGMIAGQSQVYFRFNWEGANGTYAWLIDDLLFAEGSDYDLAISDSSYTYLNDWNLPYYSLIPQKQADTIIHRARAVNVGGATSTNSILDVEVMEGSNMVFSGSSNPVNILAGEDSLLSLITGFVPSIGGPYTATYTVSADSTDGNLLDNTFSSDSYEVTDSVYARDFEPVSFGMNAAAYSETGPYAFGNLYDFTNDDQVKSISVFIEAATAAGTPLIGVIYENDFATVAAATDVYTTQAGDAGSWLTLPITEVGGMFGTGTPSSLLDVNGIDFYLVAIDNVGGTGDELEIGAHANKGGFNGNYGQLGGTWFWLNEVPMIRVNTIGDPCNYYDVNETVTNISCNGNADGAITLAPTGGSNYTYMWSTGTTMNSISNLSAGTYGITVTDANCTVIENIVIAEPTTLTASISTNADECGQGNGNATGSGNGGTAPYNYLWDNTSNTPFINNLSAGSISLTITDDNGCSASTSGTIAATSSTITINTTVTSDDACGYNIGEAVASATSTGGAVSFEWTDGQAGSTASGLMAGTYSVSVTDADGCVWMTLL